ncbi:hypothetical protein MGU_05155 [Metarhizium guizhouense ARSEF 977]|uniref:Uncharacterized protein n=1 Tax=Metarhizium guizhouense (strain ARSEF 977) TaxID=1276136 RepID=A0A0B4H7B4_METGA|nr:hypothetical protein MGU_05155 [Metarhizium guizhouense ARSEF 977]
MNSVFLGMMKSHNLPVDKNIRIAEGFAAAGVVMSVLGMVRAVVSGMNFPIPFLRLRLGLHVLMELFIMGCCIFIAVIYKAAVGGCDSYADTPFGDIKGEDGLAGVGTSCRMQAATFAVSIVAASVRWDPSP